MNKELEFIRKAVIMACNPDCGSCEEALRKELGVGFKVIDILHQFFGKSDPQEMIMAEAFYEENDDPDYKFSFSHYRGNPFVYFTIDDIFDKEKFTAIGQPITLDRILRAIIQGERSLATSTADLKALFHILYDWDYDQSTLQQQKTETISSISKLLGYDK